LDDYLLPLNSLALLQIINALPIKLSDDISNDVKWPAEHDAMFKNAGFSNGRPTDKYMDAFRSNLGHPMSKMMFDRLARRAQEVVVYFAMLRKRQGITGQGKEWIVDISQNLPRVGGVEQSRPDVVPCLTGSAMLWCVGRQRWIVGVEAMRLQGMAVKAVRSVMELPQSLASDLAGNAFNANAALSALLAFHFPAQSVIQRDAAPLSAVVA
jgi:hypothetical protein